MAVDRKLAQRLADYLNDVLAHDRDALSALIDARVSCGKCLATHPTVQVMRVDDEAAQRSGYYVGFLGLLNGLCGTYDDGPRKGWGGLVADVDGDTGQVKRFRVQENVEDAPAPDDEVEAEAPGGTITSKNGVGLPQ